MGVNMFDNTIKLLGSVAGLRTDRHALITSNVANIETPGYKTKDISFEQQLQASMPAKNQLPMRRTDSGHMPVYDMTGKVQPLVQTGGDVDIDKQMSKLAENNLMYNAMVQLLSRKYRTLSDVIEQGGR